MTASFDLAFPRFIAFGAGSLSRLAEIAAPFPSPALLVVGGGSLERSGARAEIIGLLKRIDGLGLEFIKTENLCTFDGQPGYSLGQGQ